MEKVGERPGAYWRPAAVGKFTVLIFNHNETSHSIKPPVIKPPLHILLFSFVTLVKVTKPESVMDTSVERAVDAKVQSLGKCQPGIKCK